MHSTWRATVSHALLGICFLLSIGLAAALTRGVDSDWTAVSAWILVVLMFAGGTVALVHARQTGKMRRAFAIGLTHHLRTSLAHIQTYNEMLLLDGGSPEDQRHDWLEVVGLEAQRMGAVVENLVFLLRDESCRRYPIRRPVDLGALVEDLACSTIPQPENRLQLNVSPRTGILVEADADALRQAIGNLLIGAARGAAAGSVIDASVTSDGARASVVVAFSPAAGDGAPPHGWREMERAPLEGNTADGFGLELAVVRHVARMHRGRAVPTCEPGRRSFRLELPIAGA